MIREETSPLDLSPALVTYLEARVSERIRRIVDFALDGRPTWDLCCDHGLIGLWAWHVRKLRELHLVDRAPRLMRELEQRLERHSELERIHLHTCDAATISLDKTPSNVILAGVGYRASEKILSGIDCSQAAHRAIVSVHAEAEQLPDAMERLGWRLADETVVEENGRARTISAWDRDCV